MINHLTKPNQKIEIDGSGIKDNVIINGNEVHNTINNILTTSAPSKVSAIQELLEGIADIEDSVIPIPSDNLPYDIQKKVDHNNLKHYALYYDQYMDFRSVIISRIEFLSSNGKPTIKNKIFNLIKRTYIFIRSAESDGDLIIRKICEKIEQHLPIDLRHEDSSYIPAVVFYVFSECQIFEKPPLLTP